MTSPTSLEKSLRNELARTVLKARDLAESAASKALHAVGVDEADAPGHLDNDGRTLRRKLRAQARQLGDHEHPRKKGCYEIRHLAEKVAYDHWHRILFARFLAENDLLMSPDHGVSVSLTDCEELAPDMNLRDGWEVAAEFAGRMLPQIFRDDDPAGQVRFAPEDRTALRKFVTDLPRDVFTADDSLGWCYQFWQAQRKDEVNQSGNKIGADELPAVTQLFTEDYMVDFLLDNILGVWWAGKRKSEVGGLKSEEECRQAVSLPGCPWKYLRFIQSSSADLWSPASGTFDGWPKDAKDLKCMDPCMGSGHFEVAMFVRLAAIRMAEEGLSRKEAAVEVIRDNLFGLEIDPRCTQIAAFNLALAAWKFAGYQELPPMNLACCGLGINATREEWKALAPKHGFYMTQLYDLFKNAPVLGSLIDPARNIKSSGDDPIVGEVEQAVLQGLEKYRDNKDFDHEELGVAAQGITGAFKLLSGKYHLVATNVPYLGRGKQDDVLKEFCEEFYPKAKSDLATCFVERCIELCVTGGSSSVVTPQNWLFLASYQKLREKLLKEIQWDLVARLGTGAFGTISGEVVNVCLIVFTRNSPSVGHDMAGLDVACFSKPDDKAVHMTDQPVLKLLQKGQLHNHDMRVVVAEPADSSVPRLGGYCRIFQGSSTGDDSKYVRNFWEVYSFARWKYFLGTRNDTCFSGRNSVWDWPSGDCELSTFVGARIQGFESLGEMGFAIAGSQSIACSFYLGEFYNKALATLIPNNNAHSNALWAFFESLEFEKEVRKLDQKIMVTPGTFAGVPFDLAHWEQVAAEQFPNGLPKPHSDDPTQWLFNGHPKGSEAPLQVAVARMLGYRWPRQTGSEFPDCPALGPDGLERHADEDGIVCISAIKGERPAGERLLSLLAAAYGKEWDSERLTTLMAGLDKPAKSLNDWLRNDFFEQHCKLFHQRPFIWQIWDGYWQGFSALVNYHTLNRRNLEKLIYAYLGDWIARQKAAVTAGEEGSDAKLAAAQQLKTALEKILEGEAPYDIFVRWKPIEKQPIGWEPDLNDGVRLNIRPFVEAGVLRRNPKIHWRKDRGKDVESAPWYPLFKGDRINDHHLTLAGKRAAREST